MLLPCPCFTRWHPDRNGGSAAANERFREIADAYADITRQQAEDAKLRSRAAHERAAGPYRSAGFRGSMGGGVHGFWGGSGSAGPPFRSRGFQHGWTGPGIARDEGRRRSLVSQVRLRLRSLETFGLGIAVLCTGLAIGSVVTIFDYSWRSINRGKSFDETQAARIRDRQSRTGRGGSRKSKPSGSTGQNYGKGVD